MLKEWNDGGNGRIYGKFKDINRLMTRYVLLDSAVDRTLLTYLAM